jgi:hypothetical protein
VNVHVGQSRHSRGMQFLLGRNSWRIMRRRLRFQRFEIGQADFRLTGWAIDDIPALSTFDRQRLITTGASALQRHEKSSSPTRRPASSVPARSGPFPL